MTTHYEIEGAPNSPVLVFSHSLGANLHLWDAVAPALLPHFRILRYDTRGHGRSEAPSGSYTTDQLGGDLIKLLDELHMEKVHFCGLSMGGLIGQWLGIHRPERLYKLVLCNTAAKIFSSEAWDDRIERIREKGMAPQWEKTREAWFSPEYIAENPDTINAHKRTFIENDLEGYLRCCMALRDTDFREQIDKISIPTLVVTGEDDPATTVADAEFLADKIPGAELVILPGRHLTCVEQAEALTLALADFLVGHSTFERGMHVRRTVLGNEYVERAKIRENAFNTDFQSLISHYAWGEIWTRPQLTKHHRSLITLAMMIALNRPAEFKIHLRGAINNGVTMAEIKELILHSSIYCGVPAANDAFHMAQEVLEELGINLEA